MESAHKNESRSALRLLLVAVLLSVCPVAPATTVSLQIAGGPSYPLDLRAFAAGRAGGVQYCAPVSQVAGVLQQLDPNARCIPDARMGLLRIEVADQRFSLSSTRAVMIVNDRLQRVSGPIRTGEGETWIPIESLRLIVSALENLSWGGSEAISLGGAFSTTSSIVQTPEDAIRDSLLPNGTVLPDVAPASTASILNIPPRELTAVWRVILDPILVEDPAVSPDMAAAIRPSLAQIANRCASVLRAEGSLEPLVLTEHSDATSPDALLASLSGNAADLVVFLRCESSTLRTAPGWSVLYVDDSVDAGSTPEGGSSTEPTADIPHRRRTYRAHQSDNRRLATLAGKRLAEISGFRDRRVMPMPLYLLKRSPTRSILVLLSFPQGSSELARLADSGLREEVARKLAGALVTFRQEKVAATAGRIDLGGLFP